MRNTIVGENHVRDTIVFIQSHKNAVEPYLTGGRI